MDTQSISDPLLPVVNPEPIANTPPTPSPNHRRRFNKKFIIPAVLVSFMVFALGLAAFFASQTDRPSFDIRPRASTPTGVARLILEVGSPVYLGDLVPVKVMLDTAGKNISAVGFRLSYNVTAAAPEMEVIDKNTTQAGVQIETQGTELAGTLNETVNSVDISNPLKRVIDFSAVSILPTGYMNSGSKHLATVWLKANKVSTITISHDAIRSKITQKENGEDILLTMPALLISTVDDTQAPGITLATGLADQAVATSASTTFTWTADDLPTRTGGIVAPLIYSYSFDNAAWTNTVGNATSITKSLAHGLHTFQVRAKDAKGNLSVPVIPGSKRSFTVNLKPKILSVAPNYGVTGSEITITGYNFRTTGTVAFGAINAPIVPGTWTDNQIKVKVPANAGSTIKVTSGTLVSDPVAFSYGTFITFFYRYRGVTVDRGPITMKAVVKSGTYTQSFNSLEATWDTTKSAYKLKIGPMVGSLTTAANYSVSLSGGSRLRKRFSPLTVTKGGLNEITKIAVADELMPADFNGDNQLDIDDISLLLTKYTAPTNAVVATNAIYDLNYDEVIDIQDITLMLSNYKQLEKLADPE
jgi:hypothetical protein